MTEQEIRNCLSNNNKKLLAEIEKKMPVKFSFWDKDCYACQVHKNENDEQCEVEIFYKEPLIQAKIAHELLHAKTSIILGDNAIMFAVENQSSIFEFLIQKGASDIGNACEHVIFFPDLLDMGYHLVDSFEQPKDLSNSLVSIDNLRNHGLKENGHYSTEKVFEYLGLLFTFLFYPDEKRFKKQVKVLSKIDIPLFTIVNKLKKSCTDCDIVPNNKDFMQESYFNFANDLNKWLEKAFEGAVISFPGQSL